jgi:4-hydroxy-tetrahydrodipicolinate reductase
VKVLLYGADGKVGSALTPKLVEAGHEVTPAGSGDQPKRDGHDAAIDFTRPDAVRRNVEGCLQAGIPCVVGTTGMGPADLASFDELARRRDIACFVAPNFAVGAVLMMRFAAEAGKVLPHAEIVELHHDQKLDAPSGTAKATAALLPPDTPIHSVRLPGLVAHQEVIFGGPGQTLTIRHDTTSRDAFVPGVLLALDKVRELPAGLTVGLDALL